ncbi:MAG: hypothetical protein AAGH19_10720 [Pseudomonadota bacterium]
MDKLTVPYRLVAVFAGVVGVFLLLGSFGHLDATMSLVRGLSLPTLLLLFPGVLLLGIGLFNLLASWGLWNGKPLIYSVAVGINGLLLAYLAFLLLRGVPGHPLWFFTGLVGAYFLLLMAVRQHLRKQSSAVPT